MYDPVGSDSHDEFIEIVNLSETDSVNLSGWQISDGTSFDNLIEFEENIVLLPRQFGIILDATYFENSDTYDHLIPESSLILTIDNSTFGSRGLANTTAETISLLNSLGEIVSEYTYSIGNETGRSDEKINLAGPNTPVNWADSKVLYGTPGRPNSVSPLNFDLAIFPEDILVHPEKIRDGDTATITGHVRNLGFSTATKFQVIFFEDLDRDSLLEPGEELAPEFKFDGSLAKDDSVSFSLEYNNILPGRHPVFMKIDYPLDEDSTNNIARKELLVGYRKNSVVINEIMYSPLSDRGEWIEIYNLSPYLINLNRWRVSDSNFTVQVAIEENLLLESDGYCVLTQDSSLLEMFEISPGSFTILNTWSTLNNTDDSVVIYDLAGNDIDRVDYNESWGGSRGISLEKINPQFTSNDSLNWSSSVVFKGGTPGLQNSIFTDILPAQTTISIEPNPFSPDGDGKDDFTIISYELPVNTAIVNLKIYDLRGRLIRFLANTQPSGSQNQFVWDGKDNEKQFARIGVYIIFLQALNAQAGILKTEKKTVVLAGKL